MLVGVGKTSLVHALCQGEPLRTPVHTVGCSVDVKIHRYTRTNRNYFVEFLDIGGSSKQRNSRSIFYPNANGVILVHDATNKKSYQNLWRWIAEVFNAATFKSGTMSPLPTIRDSMYKNDFDVDVRVGESRPMLPILVVGTKTDLITDTLQRRRTSIADEYGGDCINLVCPCCRISVGLRVSHSWQDVCSPHSNH
ncbi:P-loop containing nucleoside triphosphate hydrolase protein [Fimicolochytrium jonesii]|uniref:P-loop containing nucleoside triphosphate hydrolase protein n=1 Tax=Fimicolochytrium jonesii TaxID=1396493 RepID=UPI0022FDBD27|nr:P-loop containing nucleoside triphosphate hydrolase protein [Fimicolochytrium jonesii]KAI8827091.1 P-loop containing nucleoside triphosphate hydrolase protein [Fimicolochytrium jonesii]